MTNTPHKHAALIKAWADGAKIEEYHHTSGFWFPIGLNGAVILWNTNSVYRIVPEPKPDVVVNALMQFSETWKTPKVRCSWNGVIPEGYKHNLTGEYPHIQFTFDGETDQLKSVEIVK